MATCEGGTEDREYTLKGSQTCEVRPNFTQYQYRALSLFKGETTYICSPIPKVWEVAILNLNSMDTQTAKFRKDDSNSQFQTPISLHPNGVEDIITQDHNDHGVQQETNNLKVTLKHRNFIKTYMKFIDITSFSHEKYTK